MASGGVKRRAAGVKRPAPPRRAAQPTPRRVSSPGGWGPTTLIPLPTKTRFHSTILCMLRATRTARYAQICLRRGAKRARVPPMEDAFSIARAARSEDVHEAMSRQGLNRAASYMAEEREEECKPRNPPVRESSLPTTA